jgi:hypothetical protein
MSSGELALALVSSWQSARTSTDATGRDETFLTTFSEYCDAATKRIGQDFPLRLAGALHRIIERDLISAGGPVRSAVDAAAARARYAAVRH